MLSEIFSARPHQEVSVSIQFKIVSSKVAHPDCLWVNVWLHDKIIFKSPLLGKVELEMNTIIDITVPDLAVVGNASLPVGGVVPDEVVVPVLELSLPFWYHHIGILELQFQDISLGSVLLGFQPEEDGTFHESDSSPRDVVVEVNIIVLQLSLVLGKIMPLLLIILEGIIFVRVLS